MPLAFIILMSCKKDNSSANNSSTSNYSNTAFLGMWYTLSDSNTSTNYFSGYISVTNNDTVYSGHNNVFDFENNNVIRTNYIDSMTNCYYKVLSNDKIVIDFSPAISDTENVYILDTFNYKIAGNNLSLWYNRDVLYHPVLNGWNPTSVLFFGSYSAQYDPGNAYTYHSVQSDTIKFIKQ